LPLTTSQRHSYLQETLTADDFPHVNLDMPDSSEEDSSRRGAQDGEKVEDQESGGQKNGGSIGFWNKELKAVRLDVFKNWLITSMAAQNPAMTIFVGQN
jgi:hypothetical protein